MRWASSHRRTRQLFLILFDLLSVTSAFFVIHWLRFGSFSVDFLFTETFVAICGLILFSNYILNLYEVSWWNLRLFSPLRIVVAIALPTIIITTAVFILRIGSHGLIGRGVFLGSMALYLFISLGCRWYFNYLWRKRSEKMTWLFLGSENEYSLLRNELALVDTAIHIERQKQLPEPPDNSIEPIGTKTPWDGIITTSDIPQDLIPKLISEKLSGKRVIHLQDFYEHLLGKIPIHLINPHWFLFSDGFELTTRGINTKLKRASDILLALVILLVTCPLILLSIVIVRLESPGKPLFKQSRVGQHGNTFTIWKIRSMRQDAESNGAQWAQKGDTRITRFGKFIRLTRIDELPQLYNILKGDMSFIGPRPERPEFTKQLRERIPFYDYRHIVKPGLTGWAQINYPYGASEEDAIHKLQYELFYIKNFSFLLDLKIVLKTFSVVIFARGR